MATILVAGATGLLGSALVPLLQERGHHVTSLSCTELADLNANLVSYEEARCALDQVKPEVIINLVSLTNVDHCEMHPQDAYLLNVKTVENLCRWSQESDQAPHLVHVSTDHVYDGAGPHLEGALNIRNHYAMSKLAGEFVARAVPSTILRTNFFGRSRCVRRNSFTDWLLKALLGTAPVHVFDDVRFSPLAICSLCDLIERTVNQRPLGVFNIGSRAGMSKADFAFAFAAAVGLPTTNFVRTKVSAVGTLIAQRPTDMRMNCEQFEACMEIELPTLIDEIELVARDEYRSHLF